MKRHQKGVHLKLRIHSRNAKRQLAIAVLVAKTLCHLTSAVTFPSFMFLAVKSQPYYFVESPACLTVCFNNLSRLTGVT